MTSQASAHCKILTMSAFRHSAEETGSSPIIDRLVLSANEHLQEPISFTMSFIKIKKRKGQV